MLQVGQIRLCNNNITLQKTALGWIVTGEVSDNNYKNNTKTIRQKSCYTVTSLDHQLEKFWKIEEIDSKNYMSDDELACEKHSYNIQIAMKPEDI